MKRPNFFRRLLARNRALMLAELTVLFVTLSDLSWGGWIGYLLPFAGGIVLGVLSSRIDRDLRATATAVGQECVSLTEPSLSPRLTITRAEVTNAVPYFPGYLKGDVGAVMESIDDPHAAAKAASGDPGRAVTTTKSWLRIDLGERFLLFPMEELHDLGSALALLKELASWKSFEVLNGAGDRLLVLFSNHERFDDLALLRQIVERGLAQIEAGEVADGVESIRRVIGRLPGKSGVTE